MKPIVRYVVVIAGMLAAGAANAQDIKSQAAANAAKFDEAFNSGDPSKIGAFYTKDAVILPAGGKLMTGPQGATELIGGYMKGGVKAHKINVQGGEAKGDLAYVYGTWEADAGGKKVGGHWTNVLEKEGGQWLTTLHTFTMEEQK